MNQSQTAKFDFKHLAALIKKAPGPAPWFYPEGNAVPSEVGTLRWHAGDNGIELLDVEGAALLLLGDGTYAMPLSDRQIVAWHEIGRIGDAPGVDVFLFDFRKLNPLPRPQLTAAKIGFVGEPTATIRVSGSLQSGLNRFDFPDAFRSLPEILILGDNAWIRESVSIRNTARRAIYCLRPRQAVIEVLPQDWYNYEEYDRGYQWITKVARDPVSGRIVGAGMRLKSFVIDASGGKIDTIFD
ncbi:MAG TPA: hypothetical protein VMA09_16365 [Candidatus Binataceae bacterium]|nr:hypothetical protein [Candidatus Binataceae bacterium]